jgi:putative spermidine/putrescine transport system permease protein
VLTIGRWCAWLAAVTCLLPIPLVLAVATSANWTRGVWAGGITTTWLEQGWSRIASNFAYSLQVALIVLAADFALGLPAAWLMARRRFRGRDLFMAMTAVPIAIPGIALALGLILSYPSYRPAGWLLVGGHVLYTLPFLIATLTPALGNPRIREMELVAITLGAGPVRRLMTVTLPGVRTAMLAGVILVFTLSLGEFNVSFFLFTPVEQPLPVELYSSYVTNRLEVAAASTLWFLAMVVPAAVLLERFGGVRGAST